MDKFNLEALQLFLNSNKDNIPKPTKGVKTLFDVMKQPHLENVWSNIYAFFFNPEEEHGFGNLFLRTLVELIKEKQYGRDFTEMIDEYIDVKTEDSTDDSKRLDVALQSENYAILIENKVYADLYNNLGVYWRNYPQYDENHKQGVVLSLYPKTISLEGRGKELDHDPKKWVNITHLELMNRVSRNLHYCLLNGSDKYLSFLREFYQNIKNITMAMDREILKFYINNSNEIKRLNYLVSNIKDNVKRQIRQNKTLNGQLLIPKEDAFDTISEKGYCWGFYFRRAKDKNKNCMIAIICENLFPVYNDPNSIELDNSIHISVEIQNSLSDRYRKQYKEESERTNLLSRFSIEERELISDPDSVKHRTRVGIIQIPISSVEDIEKLSEKIDDALSNGRLLSIYNKLLFL